MPTTKLTPEFAAIDHAVARAVASPMHGRGSAASGGRFVLAVSGGRDSMVMLDAFARVAPEAVAAVATFDHGTGRHAANAVRLVAERCTALGLRAVTAEASSLPANEAAWRQARWRFLRAIAAAERATVATAHSRDDNVETILMRVLRGSGARGLAGLFATSDVARPLLGVPRAAIARAAAERAIIWSDDPSNASHAHFRNRVRHDVLPALLAARPRLADELLEIGRAAAVIRDTFDKIAGQFIATHSGEGPLVVAAAPLADYHPEALRALWPAIAARGEIVLDRRGTAGLARFTREAAVGDRMQLSGAIEVLRRRDAIVLRRERGAEPVAAALEDGLQWGAWRFAAKSASSAGEPPADAWSATVAVSSRPVVRAWRDGDRMHGAGDAAPRRVKRFLRDAGLVGPERRGWPVVECGGEVVWIPGVRRSDAATVRSGRPEAVYVCERNES